MESPSLERVLSMYTTWGEQMYDEDVTQSAHACQCAALAANDGADDSLIAAALLHDIGHLFEIERNNGPDRRTDLHHESVGAEFLSSLFSDSVTRPIALHVEAKRYLAADPEYFENLSRGSQHSLVVQGGPFTDSESASFLALEASTEAIRLRRWDDHGKVIDLEVPSFDSWIPLLSRLTV